MSKPMHTASFKLTQQIDDALTALARRRGASRSALVREALAAYTLDKPRSITSAVDELSSDVEGPPDLSTNPNYMAGFGK
ncbi:MAG: ribbon-helix-helix domain-containing protein [Gemmatimonadota bacterium]